MRLFVRIVGWHIDKCQTKDLIAKALMKAINLCQPSPDWAWFFIVIAAHRIPAVFIENCWRPMGIIRASMGSMGASISSLNGSLVALKHDWIFKVA